MLSLDRTSAAVGDLIEVRGQGFGDGCNDIVVDGTFAGPPLGNPLRGIGLVITQDAQVIPLGLVDADASYSFGVRLAVPVQLQAGRATVRVEREPQGRYSGTEATLNVTGVSVNANAGPTTTVLLPTEAAVTEPSPTASASTADSPGSAPSADSSQVATSAGEVVPQAPLRSTRSNSPVRDLRIIVPGALLVLAAIVVLMNRGRAAGRP